MTTGTSTSDGSGRRSGWLILLLVYAAVSLHMLVIDAAGGLDEVPFVLFGACQWMPGLLAILLAPSWRSRLVHQLRTLPGACPMLSGWLLTILTLGLCAAIPSLFGHETAAVGADLCREYRLLPFVPEALRNPTGFLLFVLLGGPVLHLLNAAGEEVFWRGYLLDWLETRGPSRTAWVLNGVLWGLWHAPMIVLLGWDFPGQPVPGIGAITASQVFWSVVLCSVTRQTGSLWPAVVMHATANALTIGLYDLVVDHRFNLLYSPWGALGGAIMAALAAPMLIRSRTPLHQEGVAS